MQTIDKIIWKYYFKRLDFEIWLDKFKIFKKK